MKAAMVVTWKHTIPGREMKALEYGMEVDVFWRKMAAEGKCTIPEMFFSPLGQGMWMVKGDLDVLQKIESTEEAQILTIKGEWLLNDFGYEYFITGDDANDYMGRFAKA
jgi:hypothetical protein